MRSREENALSINLSRARSYKLPATLTLEQWQFNINLFNGMCAYCRTQPYEVLDHIIPISRSGGTTSDNCVPACKRCNGWKLARIFTLKGQTLQIITHHVYQDLQNYQHPLRKYRRKQPAKLNLSEPSSEDIYLTAEQVAERLHIRRETLMYHIKQKEIRAKKVGRNWRISEQWLREYMEDRK